MDGLSALRGRLYESYVSQHAGCAPAEAVRLIYRRDIRPFLPPPDAGAVLDIGCGAGQLVRCLLADGYRAEGIDVSPEQVKMAHAAGLAGIRLGDYREVLRDRPGQVAAVTATDVLEHLTKAEVLDTLDAVVTALRPGGCFIARVPNAASPLSGRVRHGDFTHESWYTARSVRQITAAAGFGPVAVMACPPPVHGLLSALRLAAWRPISAAVKFALMVETGEWRGHIVTQNLTFAARK